jgi:hypothetical protein
MPKELCDLSKASTTMTSQKYFYVLNKTDTIHFGNPWTLETLTVTGIVGSAMNTRWAPFSWQALFQAMGVQQWMKWTEGTESKHGQ